MRHRVFVFWICGFNDVANLRTVHEITKCGPDGQPEISADDITLLSLCSGVAMLDIGVAAGLEYLTGRRVRSVGYCERNGFAALQAACAVVELGRRMKVGTP